MRAYGFRVTRDNEAPSRIHLPDAPAAQRDILFAGGVACWSEPVTIDTYEVGAPDEYPLFLDRRVYQGSSGKVYPLPMIDSVEDAKAPRQWQAIHLENEYVRLMLLPEIGGRIHIGYDKTTGYDFFYRNNVIKPALVGLAGPWISGGVEFNWPQHHRPATFLPVDARIEREDDGAVVVWHSDFDPLQRMRGVHGIRLRPGSSLIEAEAHLHNRTDLPQTFLWWANVAARSHEKYQSFFPDDVAYVADHARRAITAFPRADRQYYGVDYPALASEKLNADRIDFYGNIPVPTSYMITDTTDEFFGGYDHTADAGFVHWADRALSPGKKQWTWGNGAIGRAWDDQLTDNDGPYVELMAGVYTDNQPDFSWLMPGETKSFSQFWYPIHNIGPARQATTNAAISVRHDDTDAVSKIRVGVIATAPHTHAKVSVSRAGVVVAQWTGDLGPSLPCELIVDGTVDSAVDESELRVWVSVGERVLAEWIPRRAPAEEPWAATAPPTPNEIASTDELVLTATHLTQYRHPTRSPIPYLREALHHDPADSRAATALGAWHLARGEYALARDVLERAMTRLTRRNLNPRDGETAYLLGLVFERLDDLESAENWFAKARWNAAWHGPASLARARLAQRKHDPERARVLASDAGAVPEARRLVAFATAEAGDPATAQRLFEALIAADPLDPAHVVLSGGALTRDARTQLDIGAEFARAGLYRWSFTATDVTNDEGQKGFGLAGPLRHYLRALWHGRAGDESAAAAERAAAQTVSSALAFPAGLDQFDALTAAVRANPNDHVARGLLGMWLTDAGRPSDALEMLRAATESGSDDPVVWRNFAINAVAAENDTDAADRALAHALTLRSDARLVFERDELSVRSGVSASDRLAILEQTPELLARRDDLALRHVTLLLDAGRADEAWHILRTRSFRPFEGGEGRVIAAFDRAAVALARQLIQTDPHAAADLLESGFTPPAHFGEGRHPAEPPVERAVVWGEALHEAGNPGAARKAWRQAVTPTPLAVAPRPADDATYWRGIAHLHLGELTEADAAFTALVERAVALRQDPDPVDYFATSLPALTLFDTDTAAGRDAKATHLESLATDGRRRRERMTS